MAAPVFATVLSGFAVSSCITLFPADRPWAVSVPSMAGTAVRIEFTTVSGGAGDVSFGALHPRPDLSDVVVSSTVRPAWGIFQPVSPWARVKLGANATDTASFALYVTAR